MRSNHIWSVAFGWGKHYRVCEKMTKKEAKEYFGMLATDTTRNINNDYLDFIELRKETKKGLDTLMEMQRVDKGEYMYWNGKKYVSNGYEAAQIVANL